MLYRQIKDSRQILLTPTRNGKNKDFDPSALPAFGRSYTAPKSAFIRSVITTPAVDQSDLMDPPSADMLRLCLELAQPARDVNAPLGNPTRAPALMRSRGDSAGRDQN